MTQLFLEQLESKETPLSLILNFEFDSLGFLMANMKLCKILPTNMPINLSTNLKL